MRKKIEDIPGSDRTREKLPRKGSQSLCDFDLMAILVGKGTKGDDVMPAAGRILKALDASHGKLSMEEIRKTEGVGPVKATLIALMKLSAVGLFSLVFSIKTWFIIIFNHKGFKSFLESGEI